MVARLSGAFAARVLSIVAWVGAHLIYGILLALYRVDRRLLVAILGGLAIAAVALALGLVGGE